MCAKKSIADASLEQSSFCLKNNNGSLQLKSTHQYFYQVQAQLFVTRFPWCDFVVWAPSEDIYVERIYYDQKFNETVISQARSFYFDTFLPAIVAYVIIADVFYEAPSPRVAPVTTEMQMKYGKSEDCEILHISTVTQPTQCTNLLQQLKCRRHKVNGDGNCLYYAVAHQLNILYFCWKSIENVGTNFHAEISGSTCRGRNITTSMEAKKAPYFTTKERGGDLEVRLLAIGVGREIIVITGSAADDTYTSARRFP